MNKKSSTPREIGSFLARVQAKFDEWFEYGFKKLKEIGKEKKPLQRPAAKAPFKEKAVRAAQTSAEFLGEVGETYYKTYEKLKAKKSEKKK